MQCIFVFSHSGSCQHDINECAHWNENKLKTPANPGQSAQEYETRLAETHACLTPGHVARPCCGPKAICINEYGGFRCECPQGFSGRLCQIPPTIWPAGYRPETNLTHLHHYSVAPDALFLVTQPLTGYHVSMYRQSSLKHF